jgi:phosphoribosyl-ATP pyrophosphohydrolase
MGFAVNNVLRILHRSQISLFINFGIPDNDIVLISDGKAAYSIGSKREQGKAMKRFEELYEELKRKVESKDPASGTVREMNQGIHHIGKKILEEAGEVWIAAEHEGKAKTAEEISQLLYHIQVMMLACDISLEEVYQYL